jgi:hypothetical protein
MSMVLCSLLIGMGYDAYCVSGWVEEAIAACDLSQLACPYLVATSTVHCMNTRFLLRMFYLER